jgi:hypothetical protein
MADEDPRGAVERKPVDTILAGLSCMAADCPCRKKKNMRHKKIAAATVVVAFAFGTVPGFGAECVVADPTGTPLNVRAEPNGQILSNLDNGLSVDVIAETRMGGKRWVQVAADGVTLGWVFGSFIDCARPDEKLKSAPMHPRTAPE